MRLVLLPGRCRLFHNLDPVFVAACEPHSLRITAALPDWPALDLVATLDDQAVIITAAAHLRPLHIMVTVHGIRRGYAGAESWTYSLADLAANDAFYAQAHQA